MQPFTVRLPAEQLDRVDSAVEESGEWDNRTEFVRDSVSRLLDDRDEPDEPDEPHEPHERLHDAAREIEEATREAPPVEFSDETIESFRDEFGEDPDIAFLGVEMSSTVRKLALNVAAASHDGVGDDGE
jgi:Arc/MetJ-type ribon-helix-helix transcriptional regulator